MLRLLFFKIWCYTANNKREIEVLKMIESFRFIDFKSFRDATLYLKNITILVGANSSGKSNAIEGIKHLVSRQKGFIFGGEGYKEIRGESEYAYRFGKDKFTIDCEIGLLNMDGYIRARLEESRMGANKSNSVFSYDIFSDDIKSEEMASLSIVESRKCQALLEQTKFLDSIPNKMRDYVSIQDSQLKYNGENLSSALCDVCTNEKTKKQILDIVRTLPENEIEDIYFSKTDLGDVMLVLMEKYGHQINKVPAKILSDGTLRCLAILTALFSQEEHSLIVVEEFDNGIHPNRSKALIKKISEIANERNVSILITTHNIAVLNALDKELLTGVNVCYRNKEGDSDIVRLIDIPNYLDLLAQGDFGDLLADDKVIDFIKHPKSINKDIDWLVN